MKLARLTQPIREAEESLSPLDAYQKIWDICQVARAEYSYFKARSAEIDSLAQILLQDKTNTMPYLYVLNVLKKRWPELEKRILATNDASHAALYAIHVMPNGKWPEAEPIIKTSPIACYYYTRHKRCPELEPIIMQDPWACYWYAEYNIKGRWLEAEPTILKDIRAARCYAKLVIKGRWPEFEQKWFTPMAAIEDPSINPNNLPAEDGWDNMDSEVNLYKTEHGIR